MKDTFNWITALEAAVRQEPNSLEWYAMIDKANSWPTCACGELCKALPKRCDFSQEPLDSKLRNLGVDFARFVYNRGWPAALAIFRQIEARTEQLLKEQHLPEPPEK